MLNSPLRILSVPGKDFGRNPYIRLLCESLERAGMSIVNIHTARAKLFKFDILHIHWPEFNITEKTIYSVLFAAPIFLLYMILVKLLRKKIVWTVHDVIPVKKRYPRLLQLYLVCVRILVDAYVF